MEYFLALICVTYTVENVRCVNVLEYFVALSIVYFQTGKQIIIANTASYF